VIVVMDANVAAALVRTAVVPMVAATAAIAVAVIDKERRVFIMKTRLFCLILN
jgi:hypothetical protein